MRSAAERGWVACVYSLNEGGVIGLAGSVLLVLVGVGLRFLRDLRPAQRAFSWYLILLGVATGASRIDHPDARAYGLPLAVTAVGIVAAALLLARMASLETGVPWRQAGWAVWLPGLVLATLSVAGTVWLWPQANDPAFLEYRPWSPWFGWLFAGTALHALAAAASAALFARQARGASVRSVQQLATLSVAIMVYPSLLSAGRAVSGSAFYSATGLAAIAAALWMATAWLATTRHVPAPQTARNAALIPLVLCVIGMTVGLQSEVGRTPLAGVARILMVAALAYAVLRHHALAIDLRLRWGISRTALAAVFVAAFFIASEAAQVFFGDQFQSEYLGIGAAGLLLLIIAPLQKIADRVAERAVPLSDAPASAAEQYRSALSVALADGSVSDEEQLVLAALADRLRLTALEVAKITQEARRFMKDQE